MASIPAKKQQLEIGWAKNSRWLKLSRHFIFVETRPHVFRAKAKRRERNSRKSCTNKRYEEFLGLLVHRAKSLYLSLTLCRVRLIYVRLRACDCARLTSIAFSTFRQNLALTRLIALRASVSILRFVNNSFIFLTINSKNCGI